MRIQPSTKRSIRRSALLGAGFLALVVAGVLLGPAHATAHTGNGALPTFDPVPLPPEDAARGMIYDGLVRGPEDGPCEGLFEIRSDKGGLEGCTHGPDPAPEGVDVREPRTIEEVFADEPSESESPLDNPDSVPWAPTPPVPCIGDGTSGKRVQAIYAYPSDLPGGSRAAQWLPLIPRYAARVNRMFYESARETGGVRNVRFVTDANCELVVEVVELPERGDDTFGDTISALRELGYTRSDRKYLVWLDRNFDLTKAKAYCGVAQLKHDENPGQENPNNGNASVQGMIARMDLPCWGQGTDAHELMHTLGGVQRGAPHSTFGGGHCVDEADRMCYEDDATKDGTVWSCGFWGCEWRRIDQVCEASHEQRFDCNHDDYYHTSPPAGSYLATHWNTADSSFLIDHDVDDRTSPEVTAPSYEFHDEQSQSANSVRIRLWWQARDPGSGISSSGIAAHHLWKRTIGDPWIKVTLPAGQGTGSGSWVWGWANISLTPGLRYQFAVRAEDKVGNESAWAFSGAIQFRVHDESSTAIQYSGTWASPLSSDYINGAVKRTSTLGSQAKLNFEGTRIAWIGTLGPSAGDADVFLDGVYVGTVSQNYGLTRFRRTLFEEQILPWSWHSIAVRAAGGGYIDLDRFVVDVEG